MLFLCSRTICGQSFESVGAAGGEDEPEAEAGIPAGKLPANAGRSSGYPYSFGHKLLLIKSGSLVDGFQLVSGEGGVVQGSGGRDRVEQRAGDAAYMAGNFLSFSLPHCSTEKRQNPHKSAAPRHLCCRGAVRKKKKEQEAQIQASALTSFLTLRAAR